MLCTTEDKKADRKLANQAGFCRFLGCGIRAFSQLEKEYPDQADWLCAVFEDEALNAECSPTLLGAYLKRRLGYAEAKKEEDKQSTNEIRLIFEHDILEDGE